MKLNTDILKNMLRAVIATKEVEIGCDDCYEKLNKFIEMEINGKSPEQAMPLVKDHLDRCKDCRQEYEALLKAIQSFETAV
jgi:uncharacterized protein with PIN domain